MDLTEKEQDELVERQIEEALLEDELSQEEEDSENSSENFGTRRFKVLLEWGIYIMILVTGVFVIPRYVMQRCIVSGSSMENTLYNGESLLISKVSYVFGEPDRYDIIIFYPNGKHGRNNGNNEYSDGDEFYVKRVIGLPGETVQIKDAHIYINGELLEEDYGKEPFISDGGIAEEPVTVGEKEYFVLGDNRNESHDSRFIGMVKLEDIEAKVVLRIWPLKKFGTVD